MTANENIVNLNIGGTVFQTTKSTLTRFDGFFKTLLETDTPRIIDEEGNTFIDRSPKHFQKILDFLNGGVGEVYGSQTDVDELRREAKKYGLADLEKSCETAIAEKLSVIFDNQKLAEVINNPEKATVIIRARFTQWGQVFHSTTSHDFLEKFKAQYKVYFMILADEGLSWSYQIIGGGKPNPYGRMTPVDNLSSFLTQLEAKMANFADNSFEMVDGVWETSM